MSFAMNGVTHCVDCYKILGMNEIYRCHSCQDKHNKKEEKARFDAAVERRVKIEMAKLTQPIETLTISDINDNIITYTGYWKDDVFYTIDD